MKRIGKETTRHMILAGIFIAIGLVLPIAFHSIPNAGKIFTPMAIPVLLVAFFLPWQYSLAVGVITPLLSSMLTGMPPMLPLPMAAMMAAEYGLASVIISTFKNKLSNTKKIYSVYICLIPAIILGKILSGLVLKAAIEFFGVKGPGMWTYIIGAITLGLPGLIIIIVLIPILYIILKKQIN